MAEAAAATIPSDDDVFEFSPEAEALIAATEDPAVQIVAPPARPPRERNLSAAAAAAKAAKAAASQELKEPCDRCGNKTVSCCYVEHGDERRTACRKCHLSGVAELC